MSSLDFGLLQEQEEPIKVFLPINVHVKVHVKVHLETLPNGARCSDDPTAAHYHLAHAFPSVHN